MIKRKGTYESSRFSVPYRIYGERGPTILCVGGAQQSMAVWRKTVAYFAATHRSVTLDLPGQGRAVRKTGSHAVTLAEQIEVLHAVLEASRPHESLVVVGASWGGILAAAFSAAYPDRVDKLILASFGLRPTPCLLRLIQEGQRLYRDHRQDQLGPLIVECFGQNISEGYKQLIVKQFERMGAEQLRAFQAHCEMFEQALELTELVDFRNIRAKTLLINGDQDRILDLADMAVVSRLIPDCETQLVAGVGHFLHFERESVLETFGRFLSAEPVSAG